MPFVIAGLGGLPWLELAVVARWSGVFTVYDRKYHSEPHPPGNCIRRSRSRADPACHVGSARAALAGCGRPNGRDRAAIVVCCREGRRGGPREAYPNCESVTAVRSLWLRRRHRIQRPAGPFAGCDILRPRYQQACFKWTRLDQLLLASGTLGTTGRPR